MRRLQNLYPLGFLTLLLIAVSSSFGLGQKSCFTDEYLADRLKNDAAFAEKFATYDKDKIDPLHESVLSCNSSNSVVIPVAVHYYTPIDCSNQQCLIDAAYAQIAVLNESFSADNADLIYYTNTLNNICSSSYPLSRAPNAGEGTCIQFCLASKNHPSSSGLLDGQPAITVNQSVWPSAGSDWSGYLNIFVSDGSSAGQGSTVLGISALPGNADGDGFWVNYDVFGGPGLTCFSGAQINSHNTYNEGKTGVHEAGHYFGLYHVFQGPDCDNADSDPPGPIAVNDTPAQDDPHFGCPSISSCSNIPASCSSGMDNFYSYMDYSSDNCMVMFTADQSKVINYWGNFLTWKDSTLVCDNINLAVNCNGPSCSDGVQNGLESGVDCGGIACPACIYNCGDTMIDSGGTNDYFNNQSETWTVCANGSDLVSLSFTMFDIEDGGNSGCFDQLELFDGANNSATSLGTFCGNTLNDAPGNGYITSSGQCLTLEFTSDESLTQGGWEALVICASAGTCNDGVQNGTETGIDCGGNCGPCPDGCDNDFYDMGGPSGNYTNAEFETFLYCPDSAGDYVKAEFLWSDIESTSGNGNNQTGCWDMLRIYNGPDDQANMFGNYCGEESGDGDIPGVPENNLYVGKTFISSHSSGCLFFTFESDNSINESGWEAEISCVQASVPVEFLDFYGSIKNQDVQLSWSTTNELNNEGFFIERKGNNEAFEQIAFVSSLEGLDVHHYNYLDQGLKEGDYFYRLKQIDFDGNFSYSKTIRASLKKEYSTINIYPNPVSAVLQIDLSLEIDEVVDEIKVFDKLGRLLEILDTSEIDNGRLEYSTSGLNAGSYVLMIKSSESTFVKRFVKL